MDSDKGKDDTPSNLVLLKMGKYMEKMLQCNAEEFKECFIIDPSTGKARKLPEEEEDYFKYSRVG